MKKKKLCQWPLIVEFKKNKMMSWLASEIISFWLPGSCRRENLVLTNKSGSNKYILSLFSSFPHKLWFTWLTISLPLLLLIIQRVGNSFTPCSGCQTPTLLPLLIWWHLQLSSSSSLFNCCFYSPRNKYEELDANESDSDFSFSFLFPYLSFLFAVAVFNFRFLVMNGEECQRKV